MSKINRNETGTIFVVACILLSVWGVVFIQTIRARQTAPLEAVVATPLTNTPSLSYPWVTYLPVPKISASPTPTVSLAPLVQAQSALLYDLTHDQPILAHRASEPYSLASITKLMTALLVAEHYGGINDSASLVVSFEDLAVESPSKVLLTGDLLRVSEAIRILLVGSDNSAANLLARSVASTTNEFVRQMNVRAYSLGMTQTKFTDPIGFAGNLSTTMDLVVLTEYLLGHYPDLLRLTTYPSLTLILESGKSMAIQNTNILADKIPGFIGGKTGFLEETGGSLVTVFKIRGTVLATVVLGSPDRFGDTTQLIQWYLKNDLPPTTNNN